MDGHGWILSTWTSQSSIPNLLWQIDYHDYDFQSTTIPFLFHSLSFSFVIAIIIQNMLKSWCMYIV